jgi:hypothetical protein
MFWGGGVVQIGEGQDGNRAIVFKDRFIGLYPPSGALGFPMVDGQR